MAGPRRICAVALGLASMASVGQGFAPAGAGAGAGAGGVRAATGRSNLVRPAAAAHPAAAAERAVASDARHLTRKTRARDLGAGVFGSAARGPSTGLFEREIARDLGFTPKEGGRGDGRGPDFEVNLGRVIEALRQDYPRMFYEPLDYGVYTEDIEVRDPTGVAFKGMGAYKHLFATLRFFRQLLMRDVQTRTKVTYDWARQQVKVSWHFAAALKARDQPLYIDGVSIYSIDDDGLINLHKIETIIVNGTPVEPPFAYAWINLDAWLGAAPGKRAHAPRRGRRRATPAGVCPGGLPSVIDNEACPALDLVPTQMVANDAPSAGEPLFQPLQATADGGTAADDADAAAASRAEENAERWARQREANARARRQRPRGAGGPGARGCETGFDCEPSEFCCDFVLFKMCCKGGLRVPSFTPELAPIPVTIRDVYDDYYGY